MPPTQPTSQPMMTPQDFAQKIKQQFPQYQKVDDLTLAQKMLEKYPQYQSKVTKPGLQTLGRNLQELPGQLLNAGESALPIAGSVAGGVAGAGAGLAIGGPVGAYAGGVAGAAGGAALGTGAQELLQGKPLNAGAIGTNAAVYGGADAVLGPAASLFGKGAETFATAIPGVKGALSDATDKKVLEMVSPRLTPTVAQEAKTTAPTGILGKISEIPSKWTRDVANAVKGIVNPSKTFSENATAVRGEIANMGNALKTQLDKSGATFRWDKFSSYLKKNTEIPDFIKTGEKTVQNKADSIMSKFMEFVKAQPDNKASSLLTARRQFDTWVQKEYPRVFDESGNAVNLLIKNVRQTANNFISETAPNVWVKASLKAQQLLYDAEDTLSEKAAKGELRKAGEIGSNRITRFAAKHPTATKVGGIGAGILGAGAIAGGVAKGIGALESAL